MLRRLRFFVVRTSVPPLLHLYQSLYRLVIAVVTLVLRRLPGLAALYLCRGCAKGQIVPGISDIDIIVVTEDDEASVARLGRACRRLSAATGGLVDYYPRLVMSRQTLERRWRNTPAWRYRLHEGQATWRLLHGEDVVRALPPLDAQRMRSGCYAEMTRWWIGFARALLQSPAQEHDALSRNSACYKAVSELWNAHDALVGGRYRSSRAEGLAAHDGPLARDLARLARERFLTGDEGIADRTLRFLLEFFADLWAGFEEAPFLRVHQGVRQDVDSPPTERVPAPADAERVGRVRRHLDERWGSACRGTHVARSAFRDFDDVLLLVDLDPARLPTVQQIAELAALHGRAPGGAAERVFLFLRLGRVGFPVSPELPRDLHRGLLTPATTPDVFLQLGDRRVHWTDETRWYLVDWRTNERWSDVPPRKEEQLARIAEGAAEGAIVYPLTAPALDRARHAVAEA